MQTTVTTTAAAGHLKRLGGVQMAYADRRLRAPDTAALDPVSSLWTSSALPTTGR